LLMAIGAITIILAVMMALIQKDYKRLLSYHAISQVGYMILGIGTAVPIGIAGGIFHMINHALYKSGLFLTAGSVERAAGTTSLEKLGGIGRKMPFTFGCFIVAACSISGVWPFNGFFSKELVYDAALGRGMIFYICAVGGSFFTAASFLKLGHAVFLGPLNKEHRSVRESPVIMLAPMAFIAITCIVFGVFNSLPLKNLIEPILGLNAFGGRSISGFPENTALVVVTALVLIAAVINHLFGVKIKKSAVHCLDHIRYAWGLSYIYDKAENKLFDPFRWGMGLAGIASKIAWFVDRAVDSLYDGIAACVTALSNNLARWQTRGYSVSLGWAMAGMVLVVILLFKFA
jgi:formate hydrogenlyase subunit 3/multisubunit Na+/H+ antiporter MnhD subunit